MDVSRETFDQLSIYVDLLKQWNKRINLVSTSTLKEVWTRHFLDSAQLANHLKPNDARLVDLGSGAGFPGLVLAILENQRNVVLVESDQRKCAFLSQVARKLDLEVEIKNTRLEQTESPADVVTARALAPLEKLLEYANTVAPEARCLFLKGSSAAQELENARKHWHVEANLIPSITPFSFIIEIESYERV